MTIQTTSLETSKLLKKVGFRQYTYFHWKYATDFSKEKLPNFYSDYKPKLINEKLIDHPAAAVTSCAAPTTDELLDELPLGTDVTKKFDGWDVSCYEGNSIDRRWFESKDLPEALAQMYLWLKKEGLI